MNNAKSFMKQTVDAVAADYAEVRLEESEHTRIVYRGRELDDISRLFERGGCIRIFARGNWGTATFNTIDDGLPALAQEVASRLEQLPQRDARLAPTGAGDETVRPSVDADPRRVPLEAKAELLRGYNAILLETPGVATTLSAYIDSYRTIRLYTSEGRYLEQEQAYAGFACRAVARDGTNIQDYSDTFGKTQGFESLRHREPLVERIGRMAVALLKAEPVSAGKYTVVIDPLLAGVFAHEAFGHLSEADHIAENERLRELMKVGTRYGVEMLTIVDDATLPGERGSYRYDDEGTPARRTELIRDGVLAGHLHDRESAARMGATPTGNARAISYQHPPIVRMSNTVIEPRDAELDEMLDTPRALYVCGSRGGMTELESFTFSAQYAYMVEHGHRTRLLRNVTLSGNVFETLRSIDMIGNDLVLLGGIGGCGKAGQAPLPVGMGAPHLRIQNVVIGGS